MKATSGAHFVALDHVRALAAFLVFTWHFAHGKLGTPVSFSETPLWGPLSVLDEGHVGVSLFMTLSGFLFAKLLDGRRIAFGSFLVNRVLRLFPLLAVVIVCSAALQAVRSGDIRVLYWAVLPAYQGFVLPTWPNGGWSIAVELHFYLLLPLLLCIHGKRPELLLAVLAMALAVRWLVFVQQGEIQYLAYHTLLGRVDQFLLGIYAFARRKLIVDRPVIVVAAMLSFFSWYQLFNTAGGYYGVEKSPWLAQAWIVIPTIEGLACATFIAWYDSTNLRLTGVASSWAAKVGDYSYSIYLLHYFIVFDVARFVHRNVIDLSNFYVAAAVGTLVFASLVPIGYLSMRFIELPFLRFRRPYIVSDPPHPR